MYRVSQPALAAAFIAATGLLALCSSTASAAFTTPTLWTRPTTTSEASASKTAYTAWDFFTDDDTVAAGVQDVTPDVAAINPNGTGSVVSPNAGILGSGNVYSQDQVINVALDVPSYNLGAGNYTRLFLQISTQGNLLLNTTPAPDFSTFALNGIPLANFNPTLNQVITAAGPQGAIIDSMISFNVAGNVADYSITWKPTDVSVSHRLISIDTSVVTPEPATLAVIGGASVLGMIRRRSRG